MTIQFVSQSDNVIGIPTGIFPFEVHQVQPAVRKPQGLSDSLKVLDLQGPFSQNELDEVTEDKEVFSDPEMFYERIYYTHIYCW